eukprot:g31356.t1
MCYEFLASPHKPEERVAAPSAAQAEVDTVDVLAELQKHSLFSQHSRFFGTFMPKVTTESSASKCPTATLSMA